MDDTLANILESVGKPTKTWASPDGSTALVLPYGGRILGLFSPGSDQNFFWTHPALNSLNSARTFYQSTEWHNSGGDRTWLAPEVDFFLPNFPKLDTYVQPREIDPGHYRLACRNGCLSLINRFSARLSRSATIAHLEVTKRLMPAKNPLRYVCPALVEQLAYAGYSLQTRLDFIGDHTGSAQVGLWSLLQLPHGGELLIPTFSKPVVKIYMGHINARDLTVTDHLVRYRMREAGEHKLGLQAPAVTGRIAYLQMAGQESSLVIRNALINPSGEYVDVPWTEAECCGAAIEACNVDSKLGTFSELEYHVPAINGFDGNSHCEDESQIWAFRGSAQNIMEVGRLLISAEL